MINPSNNGVREELEKLEVPQLIVMLEEGQKITTGHLTEKTINDILNLIESTVRSAIPEKHVCTDECNINSNEWRIGHRAYKDAESNTIDEFEANLAKLIGKEE